MSREVAARLVVTAFQQGLAAHGVRVSKRAASWFDGADISRAAAGVRLAERLFPEWRGSVELGVAFYRLYSYVMTGRTVGSPLVRGRQTVTTVAALVKDFEAALGGRVDGLSLPVGRKVRVDPGLDGPVLQRLFEAERTFAGEAFSRRWEERRKVAEGRGGEPGVVEGDRSWYAGVAQQVVADGAREVVTVMGRADRTVVGWVRVSGSGSPCAFCAMLMSRGTSWRPYRSEGSASRGKTGKPYHPHCKCVAVPVFRTTNYEKDESFGLNRQFTRDWGEFRGTSIQEWRAFYRRKYQKKKVESV